MKKLLLVTPPFVQGNCPYPATAYLKGYLGSKGFDVEQLDLSVELLGEIFSSDFMGEVFAKYEVECGCSRADDVSGFVESGGIAATSAVATPLAVAGAANATSIAAVATSAVITAAVTADTATVATNATSPTKKQNSAKSPQKKVDKDAPPTDHNITRIFSLQREYCATVGVVMDFLRGKNPELASLICSPDFLPQAGRFAAAEDLDFFFGNLGVNDCAKYLCTLFLQDLSDFIRAVVTPHFEIVRYGESISVSVPEFSVLECELQTPRNIIEHRMVQILDRAVVQEKADVVGFTIPFPGNLLSALRSAQYLKQSYPHIEIIFGGGYPTTELRAMTDNTIFNYIDYLVLDDGELPLERILSAGELVRTYTRDGYHSGDGRVTHKQRGCPDFGGLPHDKYFSLTEVRNPMHRLWGDGRWNKMIIAHGCYWGKCAFCDTELDYICTYDAVSATDIVDWIERVMAQTGSRGFHFVDEAAPPKVLKEMSLEILRRGLKVVWWTNVRFDSAFTGDVAMLMAAAGCVAVSGGLETASDRLLELMKKGVTIEQATIVMRNFYYAGIMTHAYLMYGFPTQTLQDSVDSLEVVRQMFRAELINSAFWHRYAMTAHSPSGTNPQQYGIRAEAGPKSNSFANNEIGFKEDRGYNINMVGEGLNEAIADYLSRNNIDRPAHKWFKGKDIPQTTVENSLITDHLIKPDSSRIYDQNSRLIWIGGKVSTTSQGVMLRRAATSKHVNFTEQQSEFVLRMITLVSDLSKVVTLANVAAIYGEYSDEPFVLFFLSKKWDVMRANGLLKL